MFSTPIKIQSIALVIFTLWGNIVFGQNVKFISYRFYSGNIQNHRDLGIYQVNSNPQAHEIRWGQLLQDRHFQSLFHCRFQRGFLFNNTLFKDKRLGNAVILGYFLNPSFALGNNLLVSGSIAGGIAYTAKPNRNNRNNQNKYYSTYINGYTYLGFEMAYKLSSSFTLTGAWQLNHFSNGASRMPNLGVNWTTTSIGLNYNLINSTPPYWLPSDTSRLASTYFEVATYIAYADLDITESRKKYLLNGVSIQYGRRGILHGWNIGAEMAFDPMHKDRAEKQKQIKVRQIVGSINLGHEFVLGKLLFSQQLGLYLQSTHGIYKMPFYTRWGLVYGISKKLALGMSLKAHGTTANFVDYRIVYKVK